MERCKNVRLVKKKLCGGENEKSLAEAKLFLILVAGGGLEPPTFGL